MGGADRNIDSPDDPEPTSPVVLSWERADGRQRVPQPLPPLWESAETDPYAAVTIPAAAPKSPSERATPNPISALSEVAASVPGPFTTLVSEGPASGAARRTWRPAERDGTADAAGPAETIDLTDSPAASAAPVPAPDPGAAIERTGPLPVVDRPAPPAVAPLPAAGPLPIYDPPPTPADAPGPVPPHAPEPDDLDDPVAARHAATVPPWRRGLTAGALAVGAIVVGLVTANYWHAGGYPGHPANQAKPAGPGPAVVGTVARPPAAHPGARHPSAAPHASALGGLPTPAGLASGATQPSAAPTVAPTHAASPAPHLAAGTATVTVLNETGLKGLAAKEAARITRAGWHVRRTTDVNARYAVTTVFYERGQETQAALLLKTVPSVKEMRLRPNIFLPTGGLIVVVASDAQ